MRATQRIDLPGTYVDRSLSGDEATFSGGAAYRYLLSRLIRPGDRTLGVVMLNPSTADAFVDDPTVGRLKRWARRWDYDRLLIGNLCALRSSKPSLLERVDDPVGKWNAVYQEKLVYASDNVLCAWGGHRMAVQRVGLFRLVIEIARENGWDGRLLCLGRTKAGAPIHPMARGRNRVPDDATPLPFDLRRAGG